MRILNDLRLHLVAQSHYADIVDINDKSHQQQQFQCQPETIATMMHATTITIYETVHNYLFTFVFQWLSGNKVAPNIAVAKTIGYMADVTLTNLDISH